MQAATAMLSQANASKQQMLTLINGEISSKSFGQRGQKHTKTNQWFVSLVQVTSF
jgi:hypothetical protein